MMTSACPGQWLVQILTPGLCSLLLAALQLQAGYSAEFTSPTSEKLPSDGSSNRSRKKQIRAETYPPPIIKHKIDARFKNGILEDNNNPVDWNQTLAIVRYADVDLMYWSKPWSCRSSGVTLPVRDLNLSYKTKIDFKSRHSVLHSDMGMDSETSCSKTHYYEKGDIFTASANGKVHSGKCPLTFIQGTAWRNDREAEPCHSLCVRILSYTMESCYVEMAYHDGLNDFLPVTFNCHTFPPVMWCSSKTDLKVTVSELKNYQGKNYAITLEVKPFCGKFDLQTTDSDVIATPKSKPQMNQTVVIVGAIVGTISILFVCGWLLYCFKKRQGESNSSSSTNRNPQGRPTNQQATRYAPVNRNPPPSHSSSDRAPYRPPQDIYQNVDNPPALRQGLGQDRRLYTSPFQPPATTKTLPFSSDPPQPFYSDFTPRGQGGGNSWYPMTPLGPSQTEPDTPVKFSLPTDPVVPYNPQQVYKYPQFNQDSEMHTAPTDTRYVVYDFDYPRPMERKYSAGKNRTSPHRESPVKDISNYAQRPREITPPTNFSQRPREITPLRETVRVMHPDTTTTDHTSDNDSSYTDSSDYGTDDQFIPTRSYHIPSAMQNRTRQRENDSKLRYYDPSNFLPTDGAINLQQGKSTEPGSFQRVNGYGLSDITNISDLSPELDRSNIYSSSPPKKISPISYPDITPPKDGPVPQVPPMPKGFSRAQSSSSQVPVPQVSKTPVSQSQDHQVPLMPRKDMGSGPQVVPPRPQVTSPRPQAATSETQAAPSGTQLPLGSQVVPSGPQVVPTGLDEPRQDRARTQASHQRSDSRSRSHGDSVEREVPWPQGGPPPYSEEQSDLV